MSHIFFKHPKVTRTFKRPAVKRLFKKPRADSDAVEATNPVDPTVDPRLYRIPIKVYSGASPDVRFQGAENIGYWLLPDGSTIEGVSHIQGTYFAPHGDGPVTIYFVMKDGYTVADIASISYAPGFTDDRTTSWRSTTIETSDLYYARPTGICWFQNTRLNGDIKHIIPMLNTCSEFYLNCSSAVALYGNIDDLVLKNGRAYFYYVSLSGVPTFDPEGSLHSLLYEYGTFGFTNYEVGEAIVRWDAQSANTFGRTGRFRSYKRSEVEAAHPGAEAAILSLIAKGCSFSFRAE